MKITSVCALVASVWGGGLVAQSLSLDELSAMVNERSQTLDGYRAFLTDPDPSRAMAALQIMLESADPTLVQLALGVGIYSADAQMRQTAMKAYVAGQPTLDLVLDGANITDETLEHYRTIVTRLKGSVGKDAVASLSFKMGDWSDDKGCYLNLDFEDQCLARVNQTTLSLMMPRANYVPEQWVLMSLNDEGALTGSVTPLLNGTPTGPVGVTLRLAE